MSEVLERMKGGAVRELRSPEKEAMDFRKADQEPRFWAEREEPSAIFGGGVVLTCVICGVVVCLFTRVAL